MRKVTPAESGIPFFIKRRVSGTTPHSHTGKKSEQTSHNRPADGIARNDSRQTILIKKTSTKPDANVPSNKNGAASMKMPRKIVVKVESGSNRREKISMMVCERL